MTPQQVKERIAADEMKLIELAQWARDYLPRAIALEEFYAADQNTRTCRDAEYAAALDRFTEAQKAVAATDEDAR